ncbi:hypothetical protein [Streptomyces cucumeris]|uniref:hypothetical protein n=1 Tax=Streptomyces cucumeris TaxID=2962890 RepID=UPI0020C90D7F|nr:hypothetical protein [Streptomyces sp. NEAU-Y11]MCP9211044.1 hypothetical protein [Streptomyces sp. NEAU-Y11]
MAPLPEAVLSAVLGLAGRSLAPGLMARLREEAIAVLRSAVPLPGHVVNQVIASGDRELLVALAEGARTRQVPVLLRLAALGDPRVARALYRQRLRHDLEQELRRAVLAGAARRLDDPGWHAPDGLVNALLINPLPPDLIPALGAPFPEVVRHAVELVGVQAGFPGQLEACRAVLRYGGVDELTTLAALPALRPEVAELARRAVAAPDPAAVLDAFSLDRAGRPAGAPALIGEELVRHLRETTSRAQVFALDGVDVDWEGVLAEQRDVPFPPGALATLASRPDCPGELVRAAYRACRGWAEQPRISWALLRAIDWADDPAPHDLPRLLERGVTDGRYPADGVLAEVRPARLVLTGLPFQKETVRAATAELVRPLGADFATWRALYTLLPRFDGTATELVAAAVAQSGRHRGKSWPRPLGPEFPAKHPEGSRAAFLHLLAQASEDVRSALVEHLDLRSVQHMLLFHPPSPVIRDRVVALHGRSVLAAVASRWDLPAERIRELIVLDDPEINTCLYVHTDLTDEQRRGILAGRRFGTDGEPKPLAITDELVQELEASGRRHWLLPITESGDPRLARILLGKVRLHTLAAQLLLLVRVWEEHGAPEVAALLDETEFGGRARRRHPLPATVHELTRKALESPDGLAVLREELTRERTPATLAGLLRELNEGSAVPVDTALDRLAEELGPAWEGLTAEHDRDPLPDDVLVQLAGRENCPEELRRHGTPAQLRLRHHAHPDERTGPRPGALELLRHHPLPRYAPDAWLALALDHQQLSLLDVVREGRPALIAAHCLTCRASAAPDRANVPAFRELKELAATHLGDDPETWAVALRLLPDFSGTLPELLATAALVVT